MLTIANTIYVDIGDIERAIELTEQAVSGSIYGEDTNVAVTSVVKDDGLKYSTEWNHENKKRRPTTLQCVWKIASKSTPSV